MINERSPCGCYNSNPIIWQAFCFVCSRCGQKMNVSLAKSPLEPLTTQEKIEQRFREHQEKMHDIPPEVVDVIQKNWDYLVGEEPSTSDDIDEALKYNPEIVNKAIVDTLDNVYKELKGDPLETELRGGAIRLVIDLCVEGFNKNMPKNKKEIKKLFKEFGVDSYCDRILVLRKAGKFYDPNKSDPVLFSKQDYQYERDLFLEITKEEEPSDFKKAVEKMTKEELYNAIISAGIIDKDGNITKEYGGK